MDLGQLTNYLLFTIEKAEVGGGARWVFADRKFVRWFKTAPVFGYCKVNGWMFENVTFQLRCRKCSLYIYGRIHQGKLTPELS